MATINRFPENPIITPADVPPSRPDFEVVCVFNPGVIRYKNETLLLMRVAERPRREGNILHVPVLDNRNGTMELELLAFELTDTNISFSDPRMVITPDAFYLTTISHLRLARSTDGRHFTVDPHPALFPDRPYEAFGLEDPRITEIDGVYYIAYKSVSSLGICVSLATTHDFQTFEKHGLIFTPENMDVCIFPEKIHGRYAALHRPVSQNIARKNLWMAYSTDLLHWGEYEYVMGVQPHAWDGGRIGGSTIPVRTEQGWLEVYHGATPDDIYCLGAVLLDPDVPHRVLARGAVPLITPVAPYEREGFLPNVIFSGGATVDGDIMTLYYGAADWVIAGAEVHISDMLASLRPVK